MSEFTYEFGQRVEKLEEYEWDYVWWDNADKNDIPRVLYIGDSISCGTRRVATNICDKSLLFDGIGTSKAVDNPYFPETIRLFSMQERERCAILFNNGLHGWHLSDETEYIDWYDKLISFIIKEFNGTPLFLVLTTAVADEERNRRVLTRNSAVLKLAEKYKLPVIDLYSIVDKNRQLISSDGVHLLNEGYELLAKELVRCVKDFQSAKNKF